MRSQTLLIAVMLTACGNKANIDSSSPVDSGANDCTGEALPSVLVAVVSLEGDDLTDAATVTYRLNGEEGDCSGPSGGLFSCGLEQEGVFVLTALVAGYEDGDAAITIASDGCHVRTETVPMELDATTGG